MSDNENTKDIMRLASFLRRNTVPVSLGVVAIVAFGAAYHFYAVGRVPMDAHQAAQDESARIVEAVGKLIQLPVGETPIIATVTDPAKLTGQPFFKDAKKGDQLLMYNAAHEAILYDPVADIIVNVTQLSIGQPISTP
jgi:hypothetical protein